MGLLNKLIDTMRLTDDDEYFDEDEEFDDRPARKARYNNTRDDEDYEEEEDKPRFFSRPSPKVVPMRRGMEVSMVKPNSIEDSREICDYLLEGKAGV